MNRRKCKWYTSKIWLNYLKHLISKWTNLCFFLYLLEIIERGSIPGLSSHMNSWKSKKNDNFVYAEGNGW